MEIEVQLRKLFSDAEIETIMRSNIELFDSSKEPTPDSKPKLKPQIKPKIKFSKLIVKTHRLISAVK